MLLPVHLSLIPVSYIKHDPKVQTRDETIGGIVFECIPVCDRILRFHVGIILWFSSTEKNK